VDILNHEMSHIVKRRSDNHLQPDERFLTFIVRCFQKLRGFRLRSKIWTRITNVNKLSLRNSLTSRQASHFPVQVCFLPFRWWVNWLQEITTYANAAILTTDVCHADAIEVDGV
jgi:hypothetical protein